MSLEQAFPPIAEGPVVRRPICRCGEPCEEMVERQVYDDQGDPLLKALRASFGAFCKFHGEMDYSERWQKRFAVADADGQQRLFAERARWMDAGHVYRGTSERERVDGRRLASGDR